MLALTGGRMTTGIQVLMDFQQQIANVKASERVGMTLEALQYLAQYLAAVPGRKNLIWFSSNFPVAVFPHTGQSQTPNPINTADLRDYGKSIRKTADMLTLSKVAVYPIGAEGVMLEHVMDAKGPEPTDLEGGTLAGGARQAGKITPYVNENAARSDKIMAMEQLASDTGGKAFYNTNDLNGAMQRAIADGSHYYTLVYSPTNKKMDGSYRRIQIKLTEGKYKLAYRRGYNADDVTTSAANAGNNPLQPLLVRGMPSATQVLYGVRIALAATQPSPKAPLAGKNGKLTGPVRRYDVDFMIRWTDVRLDATEQGTHSGKLQVEVLAYDRDGNALNWAGATEAMDLKPDIYAAIQRSGVPAHLAIDVPADKEVFLATGVYDWTTGKAGTLEIPLRPADASTAATLTQGKPDSDRKPD
jgi:VWFA-related protein